MSQAVKSALVAYREHISTCVECQTSRYHEPCDEALKLLKALGTAQGALVLAACAIPAPGVT